jgi:hypothetical protein
MAEFQPSKLAMRVRFPSPALLMRRFMIVVLGLVAGIVAGFVVAVPILLGLDALGVTGSEQDPPLTGWIPIVATLDGCILAGGVVGAVVAWRRTRHVEAGPGGRSSKISPEDRAAPVG